MSNETQKALQDAAMIRNSDLAFCRVPEAFDSDVLFEEWSKVLAEIEE